MSRALLVEGLRKRYGEHEVLKGVTLSAEAGDVIAIIGASGSGKSTLLRCINLLERPQAGRIVIGDEELALVPGRDGTLHARDARQLQRLRSRVAMVFQAPMQVLGLSRDEAVARAEALLARVGVQHRKSFYPSRLSGGEQQRVAIARALAMQPEVMLFDEPTSALDPELVGEVLRVMRDLAAEGRTMIVVTHEMGFARDVASEVVFLHEGMIEERGAPAQVLAHPRSERLRRFLGGARAA